VSSRSPRAFKDLRCFLCECDFKECDVRVAERKEGRDVNEKQRSPLMVKRDEQQEREREAAGVFRCADQSDPGGFDFSLWFFIFRAGWVNYVGSEASFLTCVRVSNISHRMYREN